jgi:hypothetical protein
VALINVKHIDYQVDIGCCPGSTDGSTSYFTTTGGTAETRGATIRRKKPSRAVLAPTSLGPHTKVTHQAWLRTWDYQDRLYCIPGCSPALPGRWITRNIRNPDGSNITVTPFTGLEYPDFNWQNRLYDDLADHWQNPAESVFEIRESVTMFHRTVDFVKETYKCLRKGKCSTTYWKRQKSRYKNGILVDWRAPVKATKNPLDDRAIGSVYLGSVLGLRPLVNELGSAMERMQSTLAEPVIRRTAFGTTQTATARRSYGAPAVGGFQSVNVTRRYNYVFYYTLDTNYDSRFTMGNPLALAWNLLPLSFVVDQLIGIGDYLTRLTSLAGVSSLVGTVSLRQLERYDMSPGITSQDSVTAGSRVTETYSRSAIYQIPPPKMEVWSPTNSAASALLTDVALLHSFRRN